MPNSEPKKYGSRQKREENFEKLCEFLTTWKEVPSRQGQNPMKIAERFCDVNFQYGYVTKKDITEQALMKVGLL
jgi:hypothetical protein